MTRGRPAPAHGRLRFTTAGSPARLTSQPALLFMLVVPPLDMLLPVAADTQTYKALRVQCFLIGGEADIKIRGCNAVIGSAREPAAVLARAYLHRANAFAMKGDHHRAIADYDSALRLSPQDAEILFRRGVAKLACRDSDGGNADIAAARRIDPGIDRRLPDAPR